VPPRCVNKFHDVYPSNLSVFLQPKVHHVKKNIQNLNNESAHPFKTYIYNLEGEGYFSQEIEK